MLRKHLSGLLLIPVAVLMLSACSAGQGAEGSSTMPSSSEQSATAAPTTSAGTGSEQVSRDDLTQEKPVDWFDAKNVDESSVQVSFMMGDPQCYGVRTLVEETGSVVKIAVLQGSLPDAPESCTAVGVQDSVTISLGKPLDGRKIESLDPSATDLH